MNFAVSVRSFFSHCGRSRMVYIKARRQEFFYTLISLNIFKYIYFASESHIIQSMTSLATITGNALMECCVFYYCWRRRHFFYSY